MRKIFIGIDVSMDKLDITVSSDGLNYYTHQIFNNEGSISGFYDYLFCNYPKSSFYVGYEATSNYMFVLQKVSSERGINQIMINPYMMSHYLKHLNSRKKTDISDSYGIFKYIQTLDNSDFKTTFNLSEKTLRKYTSSMELLRKLQTQLKNFIHSQKDLHIASLDIVLLSLLTKIKEVKKEIEKDAKKILIDFFPHVQKIKEDIKGVGYSLLLELIPLFLKSKNYTIKQLQSFVGLSPRLFESGSSIRKKETISKRGSSLVRKLLFLSSMSAIRHNEIIKEKYLRLTDSGKNKMVALVACMCHLFRAVYVKFNKGFENV